MARSFIGVLKKEHREFQIQNKKLLAAYVRAMNKAGNTAYKEARQEIRGKYNIKDIDIKARIKFIKATFRRLEVLFIASNKRIPLIKFNAKQTKRNLNTKNKRKGRNIFKRGGGVKATEQKRSRKLYRSDDNIRGSFIATMKKTGHRGVFIRTSKTTVNSKGKTVKKIKELKGYSIGQIFSDDHIMSLIEKSFNSRFAIELDRELKFKGLK